jgi:hypothetical protein
MEGAVLSQILVLFLDMKQKFLPKFTCLKVPIGTAKNILIPDGLQISCVVVSTFRGKLKVYFN